MSKAAAAKKGPSPKEEAVAKKEEAKKAVQVADEEEDGEGTRHSAIATRYIHAYAIKRYSGNVIN
jgi:hypothetical protein